MAVETRKSSRRQNNFAEPLQQSRITEFVSVKKRTHTGLPTGNKNVTNKVQTESDITTSQISTPVKIKRRATQLLQVEEKKTEIKCGFLTPSPSSDDIHETKFITSEEEKEVHLYPLKSNSEQKQILIAKELEPVPVPAYKKFAHLVEKITDHSTSAPGPKLSTAETDPLLVLPSSIQRSQSASIDSQLTFIPWLPLNEKWSFYEKLMFNVDSMCILSVGRSQPCIFHKVQKSLENVLGRTVPIDQMERINTLWPEAYEFRESKVILKGKQVDSVAITIPEVQNENDGLSMVSSAKRLNDRKEEIKCRVQKYVMKAHESFIKKKLNLSELPVGAQLKQWHPEFDQDRCADIPRTQLLCKLASIENPDTGVKIPNLIDHVIKSSLPSTLIKNGTFHDTNSKIKTTPTSAPSIPSDSDTKKLSLLERIRAKEQKTQTERLFHTESSKYRVILGQLEKFAQSVSFSFASSKKTSLFLTDLTNKLVQSSTIPISTVEAEERLKLLQKYVPGWLLIVEEPGNPKYIKMIENIPLKKIIEKLNEKQK